MIWDELRKVPELRVPHLRPCNHLHEARDENYTSGWSPNHDAYAFQNQKWASAFSAYLHARGWCANLRALIVRCHVVDVPQDDVDHGRHCFAPQCCYVKGFQTDAYGRSSVVAVPITRAALRTLEPCSEILDYDPETNWGVRRFYPEVGGPNGI